MSQSPGTFWYQKSIDPFYPRPDTFPSIDPLAHSSRAGLAYVMIYFAVALVVGTLIPLQAVLNSRLGVLLEHPLRAGFVNFVVGALLFIGMMAATVGLPAARVVAATPWYYYIGGVLGSMFVYSAIWLVPKVGAASFLSLLVTGQLLMSAYLDHVGAFGLERHSLTSGRAIGVVLLLIGVTLVIRR